MTTENVIAPVITQAGVTATMLATNAGMRARITHVALGDGKLIANARSGYEPTGAETGLAHEFARYPIGESENLSANEVALSVLCDGAPQGWVREVGYFMEDGTLFAIWSSATQPLFYKQSGVPMASVLTLAFWGLPANSVEMVVGAPSVNLTIIGPFAILAAELIRLQNRALAADVARFSDLINTTHR